MTKILRVIFTGGIMLFSGHSPIANAEGEGGCGINNNPDCPIPTPPWLYEVDLNPANFVEPSQMSDSDLDTFNLKDLIGTSINGMLNSDCGGYCIVGFCAHLKLGFKLSGPYWYTIISPRIRHALPELLITSYNHNGTEPLEEWQNTFGKVMGSANKGIGNIVNLPDGLQGGRADPLEQGNHQTVSFKEVDIIGHPLTALPGLINKNGKPVFNSYKVPNFNAVKDFSSKKQSNSVKKAKSDAGFGFDIKKIKLPTLADAKKAIKNKAKAAMNSVNVVKQLQEIKTAAQTIKNINKTINIGLNVTEATVRGSAYGNFTRPRFRTPRLFCETNVKPFQPYYLSFADSFWWRSGYPITDGPISGKDYSKTILNPLSLDTLQKTNSKKQVLSKEIWGNMYPREGSINQSHDAKTASVLAWRGLDVLKTSVKAGHRVGVALPNGGKKNNDKWQLIYPQVKSCRADPYYPQGKDLTIDSLIPSSAGAYAWNYYRTYECCSNTSGKKIGGASLPKICLPLGDVLAGIDEDRAAYEAYLANLNNPSNTDGGGGKN